MIIIDALVIPRKPMSLIFYAMPPASLVDGACMLTYTFSAMISTNSTNSVIIPPNLSIWDSDVIVTIGFISVTLNLFYDTVTPPT